MNVTTLNMTTLDGGVIIKKGEGGGCVTINNQDKVVDITENGTTEVVADGGFTGLGKVTINTEVSGGGADLEGEYFPAKPNGRYWKLNFIIDNGVTTQIYWNSLNEEQQALMPDIYLQMLGYLSLVYTCVGEQMDHGAPPRNGVYYQTYGYIQSNLGHSAARMRYDSEKYDIFCCYAWQEAYPKLPSNLVDILPEGVEITNIFDYVKFVMGFEQGQILSDEEMYALLSEMFMIEPITKEEYENFVSKAENEDY